MDTDRNLGSCSGKLPDSTMISKLRAIWCFSTCFHLVLFRIAQRKTNRTSYPGKIIVTGPTMGKPVDLPTLSVDLLITGGTIVTMDATHRIIVKWCDRCSRRRDRSRRYGCRASGTHAEQTLNAAGKVIIPGLINTHTHVPMSLFRGIADDLDLNEWLTKYIFPAEAKNVDEPFVRAGTRLGLAEMIRGGTTTYCDMYYFEDAIADESKKGRCSRRAGRDDHRFSGRRQQNVRAAMAYSERFVNKWKKHPLIVPAIAPARAVHRFDRTPQH